MSTFYRYQYFFVVGLENVTHQKLAQVREDLGGVARVPVGEKSVTLQCIRECDANCHGDNSQWEESHLASGQGKARARSPWS